MNSSNIFLNWVEGSVISVYEDLSPEGATHHEYVCAFRCSVAFVFDLVTISILDKNSLDLKKAGQSNLISKCAAFQSELLNSGLKINGRSINTKIVKEIVTTISSIGILNSDDIAVAFESIFGMMPKADGTVTKSQQKRASGVYYTPPILVKHLVEQTFKKNSIIFKNTQEILDFKVVDPAMGTGLFLSYCMSHMATLYCELNSNISLLEAKKIVVENCIFGVDIDPLATKICRAILKFESSGKASSIKISSNVKCGDSLLSFVKSDLKNISDKELTTLGLWDVVNNIGSSDSTLFLLEQQKYFRTFLGNTETDDLKPHLNFSVFCWENEFPSVFNRRDSGFNLVLGNPPWGKIKANIKEFHANISSSVSQKQGARLKTFISESLESYKILWDEYSARTANYSRLLGKSGIYHNQVRLVNSKVTRGDSDLYKFFMERAFQISAQNGFISLIIPSSFLVTEGATALRYLYLKSGEFNSLHDYTNQNRYFSIHPMFRFSLFTYHKNQYKLGIKNLKLGLKYIEESQDADSERNLKLSLPFLHNISRDLLNVPLLKNIREKDLLLKIYSAHPVLGESLDDVWNVKFIREIDMTNSSSYFVRVNSLNSIEAKALETNGFFYRNQKMFSAVIEGKMVNQFDCTAKGYISGEARTAVWKSLPYTSKKIKPHYVVEHSEFIKKHPYCENPRVGFCDITGQLNERSVLAALIPPNTFCGNKVPTCRFDDEDPSLHLIWMGIANSFVIDWVIRRKISTTLNFFHWMQVPFPRINPSSEIGELIAKLSGELAQLDGNEPLNSWIRNNTDRINEKYDRDINRATIDAVVAQLFSLNFSEYNTILEDFPLLDRAQKKQNNDVLTVTKMMALLFFIKLENGVSFSQLKLDKKGLNSNEHFSLLKKVVSARKNGFEGYVPAEIAKVIGE
jgi:hypothetical protein